MFLFFLLHYINISIYLFLDTLYIVIDLKKKSKLIYDHVNFFIIAFMVFSQNEEENHLAKTKSREAIHEASCTKKRDCV